MEIALMSEKDLPAIAALEAQCFSQPWSEQSLRTELQNPNAIFYLAMQEDVLVGYVGMHQVLDEGYIANIAVDDNWRRRGIATALMARMLMYASDTRLGFLTLEVRESNTSAIGLYRGLGFGEVGRRKNFYAQPTEDAILMTYFL